LIIFYEKEKSTKVKNNHEIERTTSAVKERPRSIDITTIDTSIDGWKATKKLNYRGGWKVADKKSMVASKQEDAYEEEEEKVTASQVTTLYANWIFYYLITFFFFHGGNYGSTI
jgi:hypothetical protein